MRFILAEQGYEKLIGGIIFVAIWAISAIVSAVNKQKEAERRRRMAQEISHTTPPPPPMPVQPPRRISQGIAVRHPEVLLPPAPAPVRRPCAVRRAIPQPPPLPQVRKIKQPAPAAAGSFQAAAHATSAEHNVIRATEIASTAVASAHASSTGVSASAITTWMKPAILRRQFILTELLQPPLALCPPRDGDHP